MARQRSLIGIGAALTAATLLAAAPAHADIAPTSSDAVGIGSDTVQNIANFLADGDNQGDPGFNSTSPRNRLVSFDATPDANDRAGYLNGSTATAPLPLTPTIVLRAGMSPVQRPNGSGAGVTALIADGTKHNIDFVRMSRLPKPTEQQTATGTTGVGALHVVKISTDDLALVRDSAGSNAPATLTSQNILDIYKGNVTNWSQVGGKDGVINAEIPQAGSGTGDTFRTDLAGLNGGTTVTLGPNVKVVEENDPSTVNADPNAVVPFSKGRANLYDSGYFMDPTKTYAQTQVPLKSGVSFISGYTDTRGLYIVFRDSDVTATKKFEPGSSLNLIQTLFYNPGGTAPFVNSDSGQADIAAAGATPAYKDCGAGASVTSC